MTATEVVVVGGGPAGASCALELARGGVAVTIVERAEFPRTKVCGEYLNAGAIAALDGLHLGEGVRTLARPLRGVRLAPQNVETVELRFLTPALALERRTLDALILDAAVSAGAKVVRARVDDVDFANGRASAVVVRDGDGRGRRIAGGFIVGADGVGSIVARKLGVVRARGRRRFAVGGHYRGFAALGEYVEMYVGGGTYFAINPLGGGIANVMVVLDDRELNAWSADVDAGIRGRAAQLARGARSFDSAERIGPRMSIGPLDFAVTSVARAGVLLAGDASGFVNPFTGQGVALALRGGIDAAVTIRRAIESPANERALFSAYEGRRLGELRTRTRIARLVDTLLRVTPLTRRAASRLRRDPMLGERLMELIGGSAAPDRRASALTLARLIV
jgi:flavin-dependent dehydrogenase